MVAEFLETRGVEWFHRYSNNLKTVSNVKFSRVTFKGKHNISRIVDKIQTEMMKQFDFVSRVELRQIKDSLYRSSYNQPMSLVVHYNHMVRSCEVTRNAFKYVIIDPVGRMINWTRTYGVRYNGRNHKVTTWTDRKTPEDIVNSINQGLVLVRGTKYTKNDSFTPRYKVEVVKRVKGTLVRVQNE